MKNFILFGIMILIYIFLSLNRNNVIYIESKSGTKILVHKDKFKKEKSELLKNIIERMNILKNHLVKNKYVFSDYTPYIEQLENNFTKDRTVIYETDPKSNLTSYSINKGEELSICLRSKKTNKLHEINLLMYVMIHEMTHFACPEIGHGKLFQTIFEKFAQEAVKIGIYYKEDFKSNPVEYCGLILRSSII